jgi:mono/diheme cytochrome c family protein
MGWIVLMIAGMLTGCARGAIPSQTPGPTGHFPHDSTVVQPAPITAHKLTQGEVLFLRHCAGCHGAGARGDGPVGTALGLQPRNLRQAGLFPVESEPAWINRILHGRALSATSLPNATMANEAEIDGLAQHLRQFPTRSWEEITRGEQVYDSLCLSCHGVYGRGDGPLAKTLPTPPRDLLAPPYQQQMTDEALFQIISEGKGAMPGSAEVLSVDERNAVVRFVRLLTPGYETYDRYCVGCHGQKGQPPSREILDLLGQAETWKAPPPFDQEFFRQRSDEQLRKGIGHMLRLYRAPMPHFAGDLTADQVREVLKYLRSLPAQS